MKSFEFKIVARNVLRVGRALLSHRHPFLAQIVPMRKCNLSCGYCNEFDHVSVPVPLEDVKCWIDKLAALGTAHVTISGGEPMLHPQLDEIIAHIRVRGMIAGLITNGSYLDPGRIERFNNAGLEFLQISIDNVEADDVSKKSLRSLERKLEHLSRYAKFRVNINSVIGGGVNRPEDALLIAHRAVSLGFVSTIGVIHGNGGRASTLTEREKSIYEEITSLRRGSLLRHFLNPLGWKSFSRFQENLINGRPNEWRCRAGARYLYVCEHGRVQRCSQQRGIPNILLSEYTLEDLDREYKTKKHCAPYCTIGCVQRTALLDNWRGRQSSRPH
jgi:MoaA/NifB/PqqE/SkfB family radical SAM enzyme